MGCFFSKKQDKDNKNEIKKTLIGDPYNLYDIDTTIQKQSKKLDKICLLNQQSLSKIQS